jgi:hypothetical protein
VLVLDRIAFQRVVQQFGPKVMSAIENSDALKEYQQQQDAESELELTKKKKQKEEKPSKDKKEKKTKDESKQEETQLSPWLAK